MKRDFYSVKSKNKISGFTLIELAIVLAVTSLLAAGLWRMMSSGSTQMRDQAAADQHRDLINALRGYLASTQGQANINAALATPTFAVDLGCGAAGAYDFSELCNFLPTGFNVGTTTNAYGQNYTAQVARHTHMEAGSPVLDGYSFMIKTENGDVIPDTSGGRISSMIGNDGGFIYSADVCGPANVTACGAFGTWAAAPGAVYGYVGGVTGGQIASRTYIGMNASLNTPWLARIDIPEDAEPNGIGEYNTAQVDISLGGNILSGNGSGTGGRIELEAAAATGADAQILSLVAACTTTAYNAIGVCEDLVNIQGPVNIDGILKASHLFAGQFVYETSDERLKENIQPIDNVLARFNQMKGYSYFLKEGGDKRLGVLSQEVEKVFPEVVHDIGKGYKGVDYLGLIGPLVAAVNELQKENEALKAEMVAQRKALEEIKKKTSSKKKK